MDVSLIIPRKPSAIEIIHAEKNAHDAITASPILTTITIVTLEEQVEMNAHGVFRWSCQTS
ncbi:MAG: hypothetical protein AAGA83_07080, partial [Cyanobacteria bacterium P01_F01_bin.116]